MGSCSSVTTFYCMLGTGQKVLGGGGGPEQRGGGSSVFEPLARGGSCNF